MDSEDSREGNLGRSLTRQVTHTNIKNDGMQATLLINGDEQNKERITQYTRNQIIPAILVKEKDQSMKGIQINGELISIEEATPENSPTADRSETGTTKMEDILMQLQSEIKVLRKGQKKMNITLEVLTNQVFTLNETCSALKKKRKKEKDEQCSAPTDDDDDDNDKDYDDDADNEDEYDSKSDEHMKEQDEADNKSLILSNQRGG